jgi:hypothetical protein
MTDPVNPIRRAALSGRAECRKLRVPYSSDVVNVKIPYNMKRKLA